MSNRNPPISFKQITPSPRYFGMWPGMQDPTDGRTQILDISGKGRHLSVGPQGTYAAVTATSRYASIVGSVNASDKSLATTDILVWDMFAGQSLILSMTVNAAAPGGTAFLFGARGASGDTKGISLGIDLNGKPVAYVRDTGTTFGSNLPTDVVCDSTDHIVTMVVNGTAKTMQIFKDGVPVSTLTTPQAISATAGTTQCDDKARFGAAGDFVASSTPTWVNGSTLKVRHMHLLVTDTFPANYLALVAELVRNPHRCLSAGLLP